MSKDWNGLPDGAATTTRAGDEREAAYGDAIEREIWEYSYIHSSALGRPDEKVTLLTYDKKTAFGHACFDQKLVRAAGIAIAEVCEDANGFKHVAEIVEDLDEIPAGTKLYARAALATAPEQAGEPLKWPDVYDELIAAGVGDITARRLAAKYTAPGQAEEAVGEVAADIAWIGWTVHASGAWNSLPVGTKLFTAPPPASTNRLTDEQIAALRIAADALIEKCAEPIREILRNAEQP